MKKYLVIMLVFLTGCTEFFTPKNVLDVMAEACGKLNPHYDEKFIVTNGFFKGQKGTAVGRRNAYYVTLDIDYMKDDIEVACVDLERIKNE